MPSLAKIERSWVPMVLTDTPSVFAADLFVCPEAMSAATRRSASLNDDQPVFVASGLAVHFSGRAPASRMTRDGHDIPTALSAFAPQATVTDEGHTYRGTNEIHDWLTKTSTEYRYTRTLLGAKAIDHNTWLIRNRIEGNFPGNVVELRYRFGLTDGLIASLEIAP
jgi:hypothetical protein